MLYVVVALMHYSGTSMTWTLLESYLIVLIIEVSVVQRLVQSMHSLESHTPQSVVLNCITETTLTAI